GEQIPSLIVFSHLEEPLPRVQGRDRCPHGFKAAHTFLQVCSSPDISWLRGYWLSRAHKRRTPEKARMYKGKCQGTISTALGVLLFSSAAFAAPAVENAVSIKAANTLPVVRSAETIAVKLADLRRLAAGLEASRTVVVDGAGHMIDSQLTRAE